MHRGGEETHGVRRVCQWLAQEELVAYFVRATSQSDRSPYPRKAVTSITAKLAHTVRCSWPHAQAPLLPSRVPS
jgi:hypothetical protein